jgi:hypothetical protein
MNSSAKCYIVRHVMPQAADITGRFPGSEVYVMGYGNYRAAMADFWEQVKFSSALHRGDWYYTIMTSPDMRVTATRLGDERDVITCEPTKYGAEGRGMGTGYWAESA